MMTYLIVGLIYLAIIANELNKSSSKVYKEKMQKLEEQRVKDGAKSLKEARWE